MPPVQTFPYYRPKADRFVMLDWRLAQGSSLVELPSALPGWDSTMDIHAAVSLTVDVPGVYEDCQLGGDAVLRLGLGWTSSFTRLSGVGMQIDLRLDGAKTDCYLEAAVPGSMLGRSAELAVHLLLHTPSKLTQPQLAPSAQGSRLAVLGRRLTIEGAGPRFPTEIIDFASTRFPDAASWALYWDPNDLRQTVEGDIRLYINSRNPAVVRAVTRSEPEDYGLREALRYDLAQQMILGALRSDEFVEAPASFERGTVGAAVRGMLSLYFPNQTVWEVGALARKPETFIPKLQAALRAFWGEQP